MYSMINYSTINVKEMSEAQMEALKGLKYVEGSGNASDHNVKSYPVRCILTTFVDNNKRPVAHELQSDSSWKYGHHGLARRPT